MAAFRGGHSCFIATMRILASFEWSFIWDNRDQLWEGFKNTMKTSVIGIAGAFFIGLVLGAVRAHRIPVLNQLAWAYVEVIRNTPILVQIFLLYYGLPSVPGEIGGVRIPGVGNDGIQLETFTVAWLAIMIWGGAFNTENFRAGFEAVPQRLRDAGYALGFTPLKTFLNVTLPIGGRIALPSSINTYISVLKNTSLMLVIGYPELTSVASNIQAITFRTFEMFSVLAAAYLVIVWTLSALIRLLEARLALPEAL
jgi:His/Glu/Gln/Arg/opine family amino acid ABC transporter permease subunit